MVKFLLVWSPWSAQAVVGVVNNNRRRKRRTNRQMRNQVPPQLWGAAHLLIAPGARHMRRREDEPGALQFRRILGARGREGEASV